MAKYLSETGFSYFFNRIKTLFATKSALDALSQRVDDVISEGGEPNVIETIKVNGVEQAIDPADKSVNILMPTAVSDLTNDSGFQTANDVQNAIDTAVFRVYKYKGSVANVAALPASGNTDGDVYDVQDTGMNYAWNGTAWDAMGQIVDTSLLWAKTELVALTTAEIDAIVDD